MAGGGSLPPRGLDAEGKVEWYAERVEQLERDLEEALQRVKKLRGDREVWQSMYHRLYDLEDPDLAAEMARRVARMVAGEARAHAERTLAEGEDAWNVEIASQYRHEDFLEAWRRHAPVGGPLLQALLNALVQARGQGQPPSAWLQGLFESSVLAGAMALAHSQWKWVYAWALAMVVKGHSSSRFVTDLLAGIVAGCPSYDTVRYRIQRGVGKVKEQGVTYPLYRVVMVGYDNRQNHTKTTARSSLQNIFNVPVTTLIRQYTFMKDGHGANIWQLSEANDPVNFQDPATTDIKLLLPSEDDAGRVKAFLLQVMEDAMPAVLTGAVSPEMQAVVDAPEAEAEGSKVYTARCPKCGDELTGATVNKRRICRECKQQGGGTVFLVHEPDAAPPVKFNTWRRRGKPAKGPARRGKKRKAGSEAADLDGQGEVVLESCLPEDYNPGVRAHQKHLMDKFGMDYKVLGFCDDEAAGEPRRSVLPFTCDCGAAPPDDLLQEEEYRRLLYMPGTGHETMNTLRVLLRLLHHLGGKALAKVLNWTTINQQRVLFEVADNHKADAFVRLQIFPAFLQALTHRWLLEKYADAEGGAHPQTWDAARAAEELHDWARGLPAGDPMAEFIDFFFEAVASYGLLREAQRRNSMDDFFAARRTLLPLLAISNSKNYVPLIIRDLSNVLHVWTDDIRKWKKENFTCNGVGFDFVIENEIKKEKSVAAGNSFLEHEAASLQTAWAEDFLQVLERGQGIKVNKSEHEDPDDRVDYSLDIAAGFNYFVGCFQVEGRQAGQDFSEVSQWNEQAAAPRRESGRRYRALMDQGEERLKDYAPQFLAARTKAAKPTLGPALVPKPEYAW